MAWRDNLRRGSWRGVPFYWQSSDTDLGRRTVRHDYPQRDDAYFEDMGKTPREFTLEMYVVGPEYMAARDLLNDAFEQAGPGTLVHPTFGSLDVVVSGRVKLRETTEEGGMARFTATFVRSGAAKYPSAAVDTAEDVRLRAAALQEAQVLANFERSFSVAKQTGFVRAAALTRIQALTSQMTAIARSIPTSVQTPGVLNDITGLQSGVASLVQKPRTLAQSLVLLISSALNLAETPLKRFGLALDLFDVDFKWGRTSTATPSRVQDAGNQQATLDLYRAAALTVAAGAVADMVFDSVQDAGSVRDRLLDRLDVFTDSTFDDNIYLGFSALRTAVIKDIATRGADLASIVSYTPRQTMPSLLLAHIIYGDATKESEIITRNKLRHPGFVSGGTPLEVTSD